MTPAWGWTASHPGTGRTVDTATLTEAVAWFAVESLEWVARRFVLPVVLAVLVVGVVLWRGVRS